MPTLAAQPSRFHFAPVHAAVAQHVHADRLAGASHAVLIGQELVDVGVVGMARKEEGEALRQDHLFRAFSNTKLFTSMAVLQLWERGLVGLDDPIEKFLPALGNRQVLRPGAAHLGDVEPARSAITVRHLLTHSSGLSYGFFEPGSVLGRGYMAAKVLNPATPLSQMVQALAELPLAYHPGCGWEYSVATDVLGHLIEVVSGQRLDAYFQTHLFQPLGLNDTAFVVPAAQHHRLAGYYLGADMMQPLQPGLTRVDAVQPYPGAYLHPAPRLSGGGGLVTSLPDMVTLMRSLLPGGAAVLQPATLELLMQDQLPAHLHQTFAMTGPALSRGHALGGGVVRFQGPFDAAVAPGEFYWGGVAGTQWFVHRGLNLAGVLMTQRVMGFMHPVAVDFKRSVYEAVTR
jgi:CubicO group peptidase (beta-lactamase class C family)